MAESGDCAITGSVVHYLTWKELYPAQIPVFEDERGDFPHLPNAGIMQPWCTGPLTAGSVAVGSESALNVLCCLFVVFFSFIEAVLLFNLCLFPSPPPSVTLLFSFSAILAKPNTAQLCNFFLSLPLRSLALQTCSRSLPVNDCDEWNYEAFIFVYCSVLTSSWLANGSTGFLFHPFPSCLWLRSILNCHKMKYKALIGQSCLL